MDLILSLYTKLKVTERNFLNLLRSLSFCYYILNNRIFGKGDTIWILKILSIFLSLECSEYSNKVIMNRDKYKSAALFSVLVTEYEKSRSLVTLNQLLSVLKEEFLERDNGRK